jgi:hypothetical protein
VVAGNCEIQVLFVIYVEATVIQWRQTETRRSNKVDWTNFTNKSQRVRKLAHWSRASRYDFLIDTLSSLDASVEVTSSSSSWGLSLLWWDSGLNNLLILFCCHRDKLTQKQPTYLCFLGFSSICFSSVYNNSSKSIITVIGKVDYWLYFVISKLTTCWHQLFVTDANLVFAALYDKILTRNIQQSIIYIRTLVWRE